MFVAPIVEGHGEQEAVPILLRRIAAEVCAGAQLRCNQPIRVKSGSFINDKIYFSKYFGLAAAKAAQNKGAVIIILDCEDYCPAELGPDLLQRARAVRNDIPCFVALAYREFETWFIAAVDSLQGMYGFADDLTPPSYTENIRDAKGWLGKKMNTPYDPITHQHKFSANIDIYKARSNRSFNRLCLKLAALLEHD